MRPHFLQPLLAADAAPVMLRNARSGALIAHTIDGAFDSATRRHGLLGRNSLPDGTALVIAPCQAIHTFGMRFAIDVLFANRAGRVVAIRSHVRPRRIACSLTAFAAIELPAGSLARSGTRVGDDVECAVR